MASVRKMITIDEVKCTGCGQCIPNCPEGALQIIDGKARLVSDLFCDGLGACVGTCPEGAMRIEEREAEPYDERRVMVNVVRQGANTVRAHLRHLREHGADEYYRQAVAFLREGGHPVPPEAADEPAGKPVLAGCPGSMARRLSNTVAVPVAEVGAAESQPSLLGNWPVQLKLIPVAAPYLTGARLLIAADCVPFAFADFHRRFLRDRVLVIACPKLDDAAFYQEKLGQILARHRLTSIEVLHMEVPCCFGLVQLVRDARTQADVDTPIRIVKIGIQGDILEDEKS